jgi:hypothetical protein
MIIRPAELKDKDGAGIVRAMVLSQNHPYQYEQNIGLADTLNLVAEEANSASGAPTLSGGALTALLGRADDLENRQKVCKF